MSQVFALMGRLVCAVCTIDVIVIATSVHLTFALLSCGCFSQRHGIRCC